MPISGGNKSNTFAGKDAQSKSAKSVTHERIERDLAAFQKAGGEIEKLGNTPALKKG